jgi:hypothetical protein
MRQMVSRFGGRRFETGKFPSRILRVYLFSTALLTPKTLPPSHIFTRFRCCGRVAPYSQEQTTRLKKKKNTRGSLQEKLRILQHPPHAIANLPPARAF